MTFSSPSRRLRIPDQVNNVDPHIDHLLEITEVKHVEKFMLTRELRDLCLLVEPAGRVNLFIRITTELSDTLTRAGNNDSGPQSYRKNKPRLQGGVNHITALLRRLWF